MIDYSEYQEGPGENILAKISDAAKRQHHAMQAVEEAEEALEKAKKNLEQISQFELPELMEQARQKKLTTADGFEVELKEDLFGSIIKDRADQALTWLEEHGGGPLIKHHIKVELPKGERERLEQLTTMLRNSAPDSEVMTMSGVHAMTLRSFLRSLASEGIDIPTELFSVFRRRETKIKIK